MIYLYAFQEDVFEWKPGNPCPQPLQLNASHLEHCPYLKGHDYFQVRQYNRGIHHLADLLETLKIWATF